jgi:type I site-specific restriction endonuclease
MKVKTVVDLLEKFQDNDKDIPVILTSSQMLTTGVDARNVRNIALVREIQSMVEFKQIVGRGTRLFEGKDFFTILDFSEEATDLFYDEEWTDCLMMKPKEEQVQVATQKVERKLVEEILLNHQDRHIHQSHLKL